MASPEVHLRSGRLEDCEAVLALWDRAYVNSSRSAAQDLPVLLGRDTSAQLIIAESQSHVVGTLIATFDGWRGNMYRLAVEPEFQRRGIASLLVQEAHNWLQDLGCKRITAPVEGDHDYATGFWEAAGYRHDQMMRRYSLDLP